jgi:hypothetical protein
VPPLAVIGILLGIILGVVGLLAGVPWLTFAFVVPGVYLLFVVAASVVAAKQGIRTGLWYLVVLPCIHFGWGIGFLLGFLGITKNIKQYTGR